MGVCMWVSARVTVRCSSGGVDSRRMARRARRGPSSMLSGAVTEIFGGLGQEVRHMTGAAMGKLGSMGKGKAASSSEPTHEHDAFEFFK